MKWLIGLVVVMIVLAAVGFIWPTQQWWSGMVLASALAGICLALYTNYISLKRDAADEWEGKRMDSDFSLLLGCLFIVALCVGIFWGVCNGVESWWTLFFLGAGDFLVCLFTAVVYCKGKPPAKSKIAAETAPAHR
jgi:uncharacterized membrane protein YiaA